MLAAYQFGYINFFSFLRWVNDKLYINVEKTLEGLTYNSGVTKIFSYIVRRSSRLSD